MRTWDPGYTAENSGYTTHGEEFCQLSLCACEVHRSIVGGGDSITRGQRHSTAHARAKEQGREGLDVRLERSHQNII